MTDYRDKTVEELQKALGRLSQRRVVLHQEMLVLRQVLDVKLKEREIKEAAQLHGEVAGPAQVARPDVVSLTAESLAQTQN